MPTTEKQLVARIVAAIREAHPSAWVFKTVGSPWQMPGVPDLLLCIDGMFIGLEVKNQRPGESDEAARGRATAQQRFHITQINRAGGAAAVVLSPEEALRMVRVAQTRRQEAVEREGEIQ